MRKLFTALGAITGVTFVALGLHGMYTDHQRDVRHTTVPAGIVMTVADQESFDMAFQFCNYSGGELVEYPKDHLLRFEVFADLWVCEGVDD